MKKNTTFTPNFNPFLIGLICGFYPLMFYYSNNFSAINTWEHLGFFSLFFVGIPVLTFVLLFALFRFFPSIRKYQQQILFVCIVVVVAALMSQAIYLTIKKKMLLIILAVAVLLAWKIGKQYQKLLILILVVSVLPLAKNLVHLYEHQKKMPWAQLPDAIVTVQFQKKPNVYLIQPDGYVGKDAMDSPPYNYQNDFYDWIETAGFKRYDHFRSNYPASLTSNASMFAMKHHFYNNMIFPSIEMPNAREFISGNSSALKAFRNNGYRTFFVVEDEYFQQNRAKGYDYYNIPFDTIPYFSDDNSIKRDVFSDLKKVMRQKSDDNPRFYFVEKLLPHHIHFAATKEEERESYLRKIDEVNVALKEIITYIDEQDPTAIVIILADHGGWVDLNSYPEMFSTTDEIQLRSIYSTLAAIKWNGNLVENMDRELHSNVNLFRILFAVLSENPEFLKHLEDNSSYNLKQGTFRNSVRAVLNNNGDSVVN